MKTKTCTVREIIGGIICAFIACIVDNFMFVVAAFLIGLIIYGIYVSDKEEAQFFKMCREDGLKLYEC